MNTKKHKTIFASLLTAGLLMSIGVPALAERLSSVSIDQEQQNIRIRIQQGVAAGLITEEGAQALYRRERDIRFREIRFERDGRTSPQERDQLRRDLEIMRVDVERKLANNRVTGRQDAWAGIDRREEQIGDRIDRGIADGLITRAEAQRLHQRERDIYRREAKFKADGRVTQAEWKKLQGDLDALNRDTDRLLENGRRAIQRR